MKIRHSTSSGQDKIELQMTPMIDIVFQLLVFFIMLFKVVSMEGDFNIKMPQASPSTTQNIEPASNTYTLFLSDGGFYQVDGPGDTTTTKHRVGLRLNDNDYNSFPDVNREIASLLESVAGPGSGRDDTAEIELEFEDTVIYENVIGAITAVSGYQDKNGDIIKLIEKIRFAAPDGPGPVINE